MPAWFTPLWGALAAAIIGGLIAAIKRLWKRQGAVESGVTALLHDRIYGEYAECDRKGYATVEDMRNIEYLYKPYHALGGNGTGTELYDRIKKMPDHPKKPGDPEEKEKSA